MEVKLIAKRKGREGVGKDMFLKKITFDTIYDDYATKQYKKLNNRKPEEWKREIKVERIEQKEGVIVGSCFKFDGIIQESYKEPNTCMGNGEYYPANFSPSARIDFWEVYVSMNEIYLVPKKHLEEHRYVVEPKDEYIENELEIIW